MNCQKSIHEKGKIGFKISPIGISFLELLRDFFFDILYFLGGIGYGYCTLNTNSSVLLLHSFGSVSIYYITLGCTGRFELFTPVKDPSTPGFSSKECQAPQLLIYRGVCNL